VEYFLLYLFGCHVPRGHIGALTTPLKGVFLYALVALSEQIPVTGQPLYTEEESVFLKVFGRSPQMRLMDFFLDNPNHDFTRDEIMKAIGMAKRTLYEALPTLEKERVIKISRKIGRAELFQLNKDSPIVKHFRNIEEELLKNNIPQIKTDD
jgi:hypothetical protein